MGAGVSSGSGNIKAAYSRTHATVSSQHVWRTVFEVSPAGDNGESDDEQPGRAAGLDLKLQTAQVNQGLQADFLLRRAAAAETECQLLKARTNAIAMSAETCDARTVVLQPATDSHPALVRLAPAATATAAPARKPPPMIQLPDYDAQPASRSRTPSPRSAKSASTTSPALSPSPRTMKKAPRRGRVQTPAPSSMPQCTLVFPEAAPEPEPSRAVSMTDEERLRLRLAERGAAPMSATLPAKEATDREPRAAVKTSSTDEETTAASETGSSGSDSRERLHSGSDSRSGSEDNGFEPLLLVLSDSATVSPEPTSLKEVDTLALFTKNALMILRNAPKSPGKSALAQSPKVVTPLSLEPELLIDGDSWSVIRNNVYSTSKALEQNEGRRVVSTRSPGGSTPKSVQLRPVDPSDFTLSSDIVAHYASKMLSKAPQWGSPRPGGRVAHLHPTSTQPSTAKPSHDRVAALKPDEAPSPRLTSPLPKPKRRVQMSCQ